MAKVKNWTHTQQQADILMLYSQNGSPKFGVEAANGKLLVGNPIKRGNHYERGPIQCDYTLGNLADHTGYSLVRARFHSLVIDAHIGVPEEVTHDLSNGAKDACYRDIQKLRQYFYLFGYDGVPSYLYFAYKLQLRVDEETGVVEFARSPEQVLCLIPVEPTTAYKKFSLSDDLMKMLALSAGFIVKRRLQHRNHLLNEKTVVKGAPEIGVTGLGRWRDMIDDVVMRAILNVREPDEEHLLIE